MKNCVKNNGAYKSMVIAFVVTQIVEINCHSARGDQDSDVNFGGTTVSLKKSSVDVGIRVRKG